MSTNRSNFSLSTFNWEESNLKQLLKQIDFSILRHNDSSEPFCHHTHKNLKWKEAPFLAQQFQILLAELTNIKYVKIDNFTHGSQLTVSIALAEERDFVQVYRDKYICKGKTLKKEQKLIDLGALPCTAIKISVTKGCRLSSNNMSLIGVESRKIEESLGAEYFKLLVINPLKIIYPE